MVSHPDALIVPDINPGSPEWPADGQDATVPDPSSLPPTVESGENIEAKSQDPPSTQETPRQGLVHQMGTAELPADAGMLGGDPFQITVRSQVVEGIDGSRRDG
ncbi:hypothetical protein LWI29_006787 [Acer saccharum]|uniref:Uncharacterized protein n=1 Tax=Acer saccharum TaxID=4024 RepID=A0AA39S7Q6_ACESA|nr:hypothetical protein LWI29_006787 [Acer saccharum]